MNTASKAMAVFVVLGAGSSSPAECAWSEAESKLAASSEASSMSNLSSCLLSETIELGECASSAVEPANTVEELSNKTHMTDLENRRQVSTHRCGLHALANEK